MLFKINKIFIKKSLTQGKIYDIIIGQFDFETVFYMRLWRNWQTR